MRIRFFALLLAVLPLAAFAQSSPVGTWRTIDDQTGKVKSTVEIYQTANGALAGRVLEVFNSDKGPNPLCDKCIGPLNTDARHRLTLSGLYRGPWGINMSGMFRYRSATPYIAFVASDLNGDGFPYDFPGREGVNSKRGDSFSQLDLRVSKDFTFANEFGFELIAEVFNLFNEKNPALFNRFGQANSYAGDPLQGEQRLGQVGVRLHF